MKREVRTQVGAFSYEVGQLEHYAEVMARRLDIVLPALLPTNHEKHNALLVKEESRGPYRVSYERRASPTAREAMELEARMDSRFFRRVPYLYKDTQFEERVRLGNDDHEVALLFRCDGTRDVRYKSPFLEQVLQKTDDLFHIGFSPEQAHCNLSFIGSARIRHEGRASVVEAKGAMHFATACYVLGGLDTKAVTPSPMTTPCLTIASLVDNMAEEWNILMGDWVEQDKKQIRSGTFSTSRFIAHHKKPPEVGKKAYEAVHLKQGDRNVFAQFFADGEKRVVCNVPLMNEGLDLLKRDHPLIQRFSTDVKVIIPFKKSTFSLMPGGDGDRDAMAALYFAQLYVS